MFPFIGIQADEEPKTPISASGLYNSSDLGGLASDSDLSSTLLNGASELTFMMWISVDDFSIYSSVPAKPFIEFNPTSRPIYINSTGVQAQMANSNGGDTIATHLRSFSENTFYHICVTQSLSNNRIRLYVDGILSASAVMNYSNSSSSTTARLQDEAGVSIAQLNVFDRELSETEVAEHYVYDDDTMTSGVLGWDAMTPAQRSGLIYSSSYTDDISISGNEFNDKSGNGITISSQPPLTGEQIYFYTDASDLPIDTTIYNVNSATLNGTDAFTITNSSDFDLDEFTLNIWAKFDSTTGLISLIRNKPYGTPASSAGFAFEIENGQIANTVFADNSGNYSTLTSPVGTINTGVWYMLTYTYDVGISKIFINGVDTSASFTNVGTPALATSPTDIGVGAYQGSRFIDGSIFQAEIANENWLEAEVVQVYASGVPKCFEDRTVVKTATVTAPRLGNWGTNAGQETIDQTGNNTINTVGSPTYTDQGLTVECTS